MKRILSSLLVAALVVLMTAGSLGTASNSPPRPASKLQTSTCSCIIACSQRLSGRKP